MAALKSFETKLNEMLVTKAPVQLPQNWRKWLATYAWIFAMIGFILGLLSVLVLLPVLGIASVVTATAVTGADLLFAWFALLVLIGYVVLLGVATPRLKRLQKNGWDLIFYSSLFFLLYDVFNWLRYFSIGSFFGLIWNVVWAVVGLYFIFQIRSYFVHGGTKVNNKK